jgi:asparagine synthase (glutamine-hydrolysing)
VREWGDMSGIFGICEPGCEMGSEVLLPMLDAHALPGESEHELHEGRSVAMGVARRWGFQQLAVTQGVTVVADADLVGLAELAQVLALAPAALSGMSVAELLARTYLFKGPGFLKLLHGGFSVALWDERAKRLILAIDRMGIKSLYWRREGDRVLFASRIGGIRAAQSTASEANPEALLQYLLFSAIPAPLTSDRGTTKLRPGTSVVFSPQGVTEDLYWDLEYPESEDRSVSHWAKELREGIRASVHRHLEGCEQHDTGCYLSGGTDSSSVVAFASEKLPPVQSFSIAFQETGFSEIDFARTTAKAFHTKHHEKFLSPQDASDAVDKIIAYFDEPFANSSAIGSYYCAQLAREQGINTLLAGDGGDELFAGNERYVHDKYFAIYHSVPAWVRKGLVEPLIKLLPLDSGKLSLPRKYVRRANIPNPRRILSYGFFLSQAPESVFEPGFLQAVRNDNWLAIPEQHFSRAKASSELNRILYLDMKMTLADNDLKKVSGTAEIAGVNVRYPFLDDQLADLSGRIPAKLKLKGFEKRYIFKEAMKGVLPSKVLFKKKHGFGVPLAQWLLRDPRMYQLTQDVMHDSRTRQRGYFRGDFFERLGELHAHQPNFYGEIVWYLVTLELWHRRHLERSRNVVNVS